MTYTPSESERSLAATIQLLSIFFFFVPSLIIMQTRWRESPYIQLWAKANLIWSLFLIVPIFTLILLDLLVGAKDVYVVVWSAHMMMVVVCAFASMFNRPIGYFVITRRYCRDEMAGVFGSAMVSDLKDSEEARAS
jgi:glucan phosphoethanolaminetransferase (alkaline phosphatase superfamily)